MSGTGRLSAPGFPEAAVRDRARRGAAAAFPAAEEYGSTLYGAASAAPGPDGLDAMRLVPPLFMERRLEKLIDLGREPVHGDVDLATRIGGLHAPLPVYVSATGSTRAASGDAGLALSRQAGALGLPMVIGENVVPTGGYRRGTGGAHGALLDRLTAYGEALAPGVGGVVVQQSTEDADAEVWNLLYSDPGAAALLDSGRLAFELKLGQGAKPGLGGMTVLDDREAARLGDRFGTEALFPGGTTLRSATPGTFTAEILRQQIRLMRNNFPRARVWVKLFPGRDVADAVRVAVEAGADAVAVDGAEGGTGWAPGVFLRDVGLPLAECLHRLAALPRPVDGGLPLLVSGRMWEGGRVAKSLALGAAAAGLGRAALLAVDEDPRHGLGRLVDCLAFELRLLISALGKYRPAGLGPDDVWTAAAASAGEHPGVVADRR
ncbi:glutamate synthase-related protein [Actinacidiphila rubida]|uniref:Glutamate synthase (NADPH) GltB2 subunit n=1 Tax=Actinacidiphila rubida TaxID=310780 RepID=A0A1H8KA86_9ACTN|nr:glutamate synthase-related protein [Actinacidiphila rubida]SEN89863.1 glutamate synthase (NADPH) GltB2 subunit [Actinacidiphila rubida]